MEKVKKYQKQIFWALSGLVILIFVFSIYSQRENVFRKFDFKKYEDKYNKSQWVVAKSKNQISDEDLYIYAGYKLIHGYDPSLVSAEVPPLGKYLIGFSEQVFGYVGIYGVFFSGLSLILFFILNKMLFKSNILAIIPVLLLSLETLFREQIYASLLDTQYLSLLLLTFIFVLRKNYLLAGISAGLFMATKSPFITAVLYASIFGFFILNKMWDFKKFVIMPLATVITYILIHARLFMLGHSFRYFLSVQHYMIHFYQTGAGGVIGAYFPLLLTGYWFTWFNGNRFIGEWTPVWPLAFILTIYAFYKLIKGRKFDDGFTLISIWLVLYSFFMIFTPIFPRYLLLTIPFMYNLAVWALSRNTRLQSLVS